MMNVTNATQDEARSFATAFRSFLDWIHAADNDADQRNEVVALISDFLGTESREHSVVTRPLPMF
jgi:hypothetical protein